MTRPHRVAVVGAGPSGFYAAEALLRSGRPIEVDLFERLPVPYGLVRFGVAPDHPKLKQVTTVFDRIAAMPGLRFFGGVRIGEAVPVEMLRSAYHAVILATGACLPRAADIAGAHLAGSHAASDFVGWYNGHPDHRDHHFDLSGERAVVIGHGNVALDVARILMKTPDELRHTDIAAHALDALTQSRIREVHVVGRGGPAATRFSAKELQEFDTLAECCPGLVAEELPPDAFATERSDPERALAIGLLAKFACNETVTGRRRCVFRFHLEPQALQGSLRVERALFRRKGAAPGAPVAIDCGLVLSSIGRRSLPMTDIPYDTTRGVHANLDGRIAIGGLVVPGLYACGWCKRGPQGTIGTNRACAAETVEHVLADLVGPARDPLMAVDDLLARLADLGQMPIDFSAWKRIDAAEVEAGRRSGKPREKFVSIAAMTEVLRQGAAAC